MNQMHDTAAPDDGQCSADSMVCTVRKVCADDDDSRSFKNESLVSENRWHASHAGWRGAKHAPSHRAVPDLLEEGATTLTDDNEVEASFVSSGHQVGIGSAAARQHSNCGGSLLAGG